MYKNIEKQTKLNLKDQCILRSATVGITLLNLRSREIIPRSWYKLLAIIFANP